MAEASKRWQTNLTGQSSRLLCRAATYECSRQEMRNSTCAMSLIGETDMARCLYESVICAEADIPCRYKLLHLASAIHRSVALIAAAHRPSAGCPRCRAFPTSQIAKNALDRASSTSNRCSWSP